MHNSCKRMLFLSIVALLSGYFIFAHKQEALFMPYSLQRIETQEHTPSSQLLSLLALLNVSHDGTWSSIVSATQQSWLRKPGSERWHMEEIVTEKYDEIMHLLHEIECIDEVKPQHAEYEYALVLGATVTRVRSRLAYLMDLWKRGIRFKHIVLLGSDRPLDPTIEPESSLVTSENPSFPFDPAWRFNGMLPKTEGEMMRFVFDQMQLPAGFETVTWTFINTPMQQTPQGGLRRANTMDTIKQWLASNPKPGTCLAISNQPYVGYQDAVVHTGLPKTFSIETVGHAASRDEKIAVYLDTLARWIYQTQQPKV